MKLVRVNDSTRVAVYLIERTAVTYSPDSKVVSKVQRGPQGPPGETEGATFVAVAGSIIHGQRVVRIDGALAFHPSVHTPAHAGQIVGVATHSAIAGESVLIRTKGLIQHNGWSFGSDVVFVGDAGHITQSPDTTGWILVIGRTISADTIDVDPEPPIL